MNQTMKRIFIRLAIMLAFGLGASTASDPTQPHARPFGLIASGQIDITTGEAAFGGTGTHLGLYTANGFLNPSNFSITGTIEAANGDMLNFTAFFVIGSLGQIEATFNIAGGTGRFVDATGSASGPVDLEADFSFSTTTIGYLTY